MLISVTNFLKTLNEQLYIYIYYLLVNGIIIRKIIYITGINPEAIF